jgi:hypothetical protein
MAKRLFVAFAIEDVFLRDALRGQARNENSPFEFVDMSAKEPWKEEWKRNCRTRIKGCAGVIAIITNNTKNAAGQLWEMNCAVEENIPLLLLNGDGSATRAPQPYEAKSLTPWSWQNLKSFIDRI